MGNMELEFTNDSAKVHSALMDSREIAELTGKQHGHVLRDIRNIIDSISSNPKMDSLTPKGIIQEINEQGQVKCYKLPFRETMILVSGYSVELRARIVDRWMELEARKTPKTFAEALQLAADQAKLIEQQTTQITLMQPKAEFYDAVTDSTDAIEMKDTAKVINAGIGRNDLMKLLRDKKVLMDNNTPYQSYIDKGYFRVIETKNTDQYGTTRIFLQTVVYQRGVEFIRKVVEKYHT